MKVGDLVIFKSGLDQAIDNTTVVKEIGIVLTPVNDLYIEFVRVAFPSKTAMFSYSSLEVISESR